MTTSLPIAEVLTTDVHITDRTFEFASRVVNLCKFLDEQPGVRRTLARQLIRAGTSIGVNIEESQAALSTADFMLKLGTALKDTREARYWLRLLISTELVPESRLNPLVAESEELIGIITSILTKTKHGQFEDFGDFL